MAELTVSQQQTSEYTADQSGRALLGGNQCLCGDDIKADDLVVANFDNKRVHTGGGLYLLQSADGWRGCRRMMRVPDGVAIDRDGYGDWMTVPNVEAFPWQVVASVETVYKPTRY